MNIRQKQETVFDRLTPMLLLIVLLFARLNAQGAVGCDGPEARATIHLPRANISVLDPGTNVIVFRLAFPVGNSTTLGLSITGAGTSEIFPLPTAVGIPALQTNAVVTIRPRLRYPFASKTVTVTIVSSLMEKFNIDYAGANSVR